ncbi:MAG: CPBP family intramembrane glutamic endopeptidase [Athalassotoga sp.]
MELNSRHKKSDVIYYFLMIFLAIGAIGLTEPPLLKDGVLKYAYVLKGATSPRDIFMAYIYFALSLIVVSFIHFEYFKRSDYLVIRLKELFKYELSEIGFKIKKFKLTPVKWKRIVLLIIFLYISLKLLFISLSLNELIIFVFMIPLTLGEEIFYRYAIFKVLRGMRLNTFMVYVISATVFSSGHFYYNSGYSPWFSFIYNFIFGLFCQYAYENTGWSIYTPWILHLINNIA